MRAKAGRLLGTRKGVFTQFEPCVAKKPGVEALRTARRVAFCAQGIRGVADIVINHRCGDQQDSEGRWNVFTSTGIESRKSFAGVMDWQGWAITLGDKFSDGTGERGPGQYDDQFDAAPDIDHGNAKAPQRGQRFLGIAAGTAEHRDLDEMAKTGRGF